jgi:hypothetical protein
MGIAAAGAGFELLVKVIGMIGDAKAWRCHVRMWAYGQKAGRIQDAELLEQWVHDASRHLEVFGGQRREALRMWAYEQSADAPERRVAATELYDWAVLAEERPAGEPEPDAGGFGGFADKTAASKTR